jgi:hypothetical protein
MSPELPISPGLISIYMQSVGDFLIYGRLSMRAHNGRFERMRYALAASRSSVTANGGSCSARR